MWKDLFDNYSSMDAISEAAFQARMSSIAYNGHKMEECIAEFEILSAQLDTIQEFMDQGMLIKLFFESFESKKEIDYGSAI